MPGAVSTPRDYYYLCCQCGGIAPANEFEALHYNLDTGELEPAHDGEEDPVLRCPVCGWDHEDNDSNPGLYDGTLASVQAERDELLSGKDADWGEWWAEEQAKINRKPPSPNEQIIYDALLDIARVHAQSPAATIGATIEEVHGYIAINELWRGSRTAGRPIVEGKQPPGMWHRNTVRDHLNRLTAKGWLRKVVFDKAVYTPVDFENL